MVQYPLILISSGRIMGELSMQRRQSDLYGACLARAGGAGVLYAQGDAEALARRCDGLLLAGGGDMHPARYGQERGGLPLQIDTVRDAEEQALLEAFCGLKKPVFGVCRGAQVINVLFGGTLYQHIENHRSTCHPVACSARLAALIGAAPMVNSYHHQAIASVAPGLRVAARAPDGAVEAVWHERLPILGVQWHPERMAPPLCDDVDGADHLPLFEWLTQQC